MKDFGLDCTRLPTSLKEFRSDKQANPWDHKAPKHCTKPENDE